MIMIATLFSMQSFILGLSNSRTVQAYQDTNTTAMTISSQVETHSPLKKLEIKKNFQPQQINKLNYPIHIGTKTRAEWVEEHHKALSTQQNYISDSLPPISTGVPSNQVIITSDYRSQSSTGGAIIALHTATGQGFADQETVMATNVVTPYDAITKIVASKLVAGRYYALTEQSQLIQIDDTNGDYVADRLIAYNDVVSISGLGIGLCTAVLDNGTEAVYVMTVEPGFDNFLYTSDDFMYISAFLDTNGNNQLDTVSTFFQSNLSLTSMGGFTSGVENSLLFNICQFDSSGNLIAGAIFSYYDSNRNGIPESFTNNNDGVFVDSTNADMRPAIASDIVQSGTNYYVTAPLTALGLDTQDDIAIYSDINARQIADSSPLIFSKIPGITNFSSDLGGLAVSSDGTRVAITRNQLTNGKISGSSILMLTDNNLTLHTSQPPSTLMDNGISGLAGTCFSNADLLSPQPILAAPKFKSNGKFYFDAIGAHVQTGAKLVVDKGQKFALRLIGDGTKWVVTTKTLSNNGLTIAQVLTPGQHTILVRNPDGQQSLPVNITVK